MTPRIHNMSMKYGLLADISLNIRRYPYKDQTQFEETMFLERARLRDEKDASEWVLFEINKQTFTRDFLLNPDGLLSTSWSSFDAVENLLLAMSMTDEHSQAMVAFGQMLTEALAPMGLNHALQSYIRRGVEGETRNKIPDNGWSPNRLPHGRSKKWPAVVLEVAVSESQPKLQSDVRFWLRESQGEVKIVLVLTVNRKRPEIVIEKWELSQDDRPHRIQKVAVYKGGNNCVYVRGVLTVEFKKLFLRAITTPREADVQFSEDELKALAEPIWEWQGY